jgi:hypothetical protein
MALGNSMKFIRNFIQNKELRKECNSFSKGELHEHFDFNELEFEDALNMELVKCQSYEEAERVHQVKFWYQLL